MLNTGNKNGKEVLLQHFTYIVLESSFLAVDTFFLLR